MSGSVIAQPSVTLSLANADLAVSNTAHKVLLVGQQGATATKADGELTQNISSEGAPENGFYGEDSMLAEMIRAFKSINKVSQVDAIGLDDAGGGVPRVVEFTLSGTATAAGTITVTVGSETNHRFAVAIPDATTATAAGALITAAVNADTKVGFTCSDSTGTVTLTANNDGTVYNDLGVEVVMDVAGLTSGSVVESTPGATDPTLTGILDVATDRYQAVVWPYADTTVLAAYLDPRFNATNEILDGVGIVTIQDTLTPGLATLNALNNQNLVHFLDEQITETLYLGPAQNEASFVKSSYFAAVRALRFTENASLSLFLTTSSSLDQFGGTATASLPYFNTPISALPAIKAGRGWTSGEIEQIADAGGSVMGMNLTGTTGLVGEVYTTYKTDPASNPDPTWEFLNYVDTGSNVREYMFNNLKARFAQSRLTEGSVSRGRDMANAVVIRAYVEQLYKDLAGPDFVLVQDGEDAIQFFKDNLTVSLDLASGTATLTMLVPIVTQLRVIVATVKIAFTTAT